jgi:hypothetical protein
MLYCRSSGEAGNLGKRPKDGSFNSEQVCRAATHDVASLYEAFPAAEAHRFRQRLEIHYTPRSGSWLNVAEIELGVLSRQCLDRRIGSAEELARETSAWQDERNAHGGTVKWRFTTADARIRLRHLCPHL